MRKNLFVLQFLPKWFQIGTSRSFWKADAIGGLEFRHVRGLTIHVECILREPKGGKNFERLMVHLF